MRTPFKLLTVCLLSLHITTTMAQQHQIIRKDLLKAMMNQKVTDVDIKEVTVPAGQIVPKHLHPCPVVGYVVSGNVLFQVEGEEIQLLKEGDAFYEPKDKTVLHFDNASKDKPLTFIAFYLKEGVEENIKVLN